MRHGDDCYDDNDNYNYYYIDLLRAVGGTEMARADDRWRHRQPGVGTF